MKFLRPRKRTKRNFSPPIAVYWIGGAVATVVTAIVAWRSTPDVNQPKPPETGTMQAFVERNGLVIVVALIAIMYLTANSRKS